MKCSTCKKRNRREGQRTCKQCHAEYMKLWRKNNPLTEEQRLKDNARSYAYVYLKRGKIKKQPCKRCKSQNSQMHHPNYKKPLLIIWLCGSCHQLLHKEKNVKRGTKKGIQ